MRMRYRAGDVLMREGDPSDFSSRIVEGRVVVLRHRGDGEILLGELGPGDFAGEMGVIERKPRSATVRALTDVVVDLISADAFLDHMAADPETARALLFRLSERVRSLTDEVVQLRHPASEAEMAEPAPAMEAAVEEPPIIEVPPDPRVIAYQRSATASAQIGLRFDGMPNARTVWIEQVPFRIGRTESAGQPATVGKGTLRLPDTDPYRLSAPHFAIDRDVRLGLVVRDLDSELGTTVNGQFLGGIFSKDTEILQTGENVIVAGGVSSPFVFRVTVG